MIRRKESSLRAEYRQRRRRDGKGQATVCVPDIYCTANLLLDQHGYEAPIHAAMRADELMQVGNLAGRPAWPRALKAVEVLLDKRLSRDGEAVHYLTAAPQATGRDAGQPHRVAGLCGPGLPGGR